MEERSQLGDLQNLYVYSAARNRRVPLGVVSTIDYEMQDEKILPTRKHRRRLLPSVPAATPYISSVTCGARSEAVNSDTGTLPAGKKLA